MANDRFRSAEPDALLLGGATADGGPQTNVVHVVHKLLRGRYLLAILAGGIGAAAGAAAGWYSQKPQYVCQGQVQIQSSIPKIVFDTEQSSSMPYFHAFVSTQASLLQGTRVVTAAMKSDAWRALGRGFGPEQERHFRNSLDVSSPHNAVELIIVSFTDENREAAATAVSEVIHAYEDMYGQEGSFTDAMVTRVKEIRDGLLREATGVETSISELARPYGSTDLGERMGYYMRRSLELTSRLDEVTALLTDRGLKPGDLPAPQAEGRAPVAGEPEDPTPEQIAAQDPMMNEYLNQRRAALEVLDRLSATGLLSRHPEVIRAQATASAVENKIHRYQQEWLAGNRGAPERAQNLGGLTDEQLLKRYAMIEQQVKDAENKNKEVGQVHMEILSLISQLTNIRNELAIADHRLNAITVERSGPQTLGGRITVLSYGDTPTFPEVDARKKFAAMGLVFGGGLPVGLVLLWGLARRRFRYSDEAKDLGANLALLGVLPNLPKKGLADPEDAAAATHCVHQIRTMLQLGGRPSDKVYCLTSAEAGEGKTSLTLALGLSYARSGARTLLIDADMIGRGLTTDLNVRVDHGLADALRAGRLNGTVMETQFDRVSVLPVGSRDERAIPEFTAFAARKLLDDARAEYDIILVDTGPILGSLEAACVSANADGVVVVIGRGQHRGRLERALEHLRSCQARVVGLVFNRAAATDFAQSGSTTSKRSVSASISVPQVLHVDADEQARMSEVGPLASALLMTARRAE